MSAEQVAGLVLFLVIAGGIAFYARKVQHKNKGGGKGGGGGGGGKPVEPK